MAIRIDTVMSFGVRVVSFELMEKTKYLKLKICYLINMVVSMQFIIYIPFL